MNAVEKSNLMDNAPAGNVSKRKAKNRKQQRQQQQQTKQQQKQSQVNTNSDDIKVKKTKTGIPTAETLQNVNNPENIHLFKQKLIDCLRIKTNGCIQQNNHITGICDDGNAKITEEGIDLRRTHITPLDGEYMGDNVDIGAIALNLKSKNQIVCDSKHNENRGMITSTATRQTKIKSKSNDCTIQLNSDLITNIIIFPEEHILTANSIDLNQQNLNSDHVSQRVSSTITEEGKKTVKIDPLSNVISSPSHYIDYSCVNGELTPTLPSASSNLSHNNSYYANSSSSSSDSVCCNNKKCTVAKKSKTKSLKAIAAASSLTNATVSPSSVMSGSSDMSSWPSSTTKTKSIDSKKFKKFVELPEKSENVAVGINGNNNYNDLIVIGAILPNSKIIPSTSTTKCDEASGYSLDFDEHLSYYGTTYQLNQEEEQHPSSSATQYHYQRIQNDEISNTLRDKVKIVASEQNDGNTICKNKKIEELMHSSFTGACNKNHVQYNGNISNNTNDNFKGDGQVNDEDDNDGNNFLDNDDMQIDENTDNENKISSQGLDLRINIVKQTSKPIVNENLPKDINAEKDCKKEIVISPGPSISSQQSTSSVIPCRREDGTLEPSDIIIDYKEYESELQMQDIMRLIQKELSEPYSIYTYRYFIYNWPKLCFLAAHGSEYVGAIVCKLDMHMNVKRGYIAMLAVKKEYRKMKIGTNLVQKAIEAMLADDAAEVVLETEMKNIPALRLYENLGFVRDKRLFRYYLNGVDALRLKLWFR